MTTTFNGDIPGELTVLVVDDDAVVRSILKKTLSAKYEVILAENGVIAWEILKGNTKEVDVVLTDMHMPHLDGMGLLRRIKRDFPDICVIVLSGTSDTTQAVQAIRKGAHDYIAKPFSSMEELDIIIWRWFQQQTLENKLAQYAALHKEMMRNMKSRTFMALDIVKSRELKRDEDPFLVQFSFAAYHDFIAGIVLQNRGSIHSTAGDGIMTCFILPANALEAANLILCGLDAFNSNRNRLDTPFQLRIGIHTGSVLVEKSGSINEMFSETLDIAGHIQKSAPANGILLSEITRENLQHVEGLVLTDSTIDGLRVYYLKANQLGIEQ